MQDLAEFQSQYCSNLDIKRICSFDYELIDEKTFPLYHQSPRFLYIKKGKAKFKVDTELYEVGENCLLSILPWDCTEVVEVEEALQYEIIKYNYDVVANMLHSIIVDNLDETPILKKLEITPVITLNEDTKKEVETLFSKVKEEVGIESLLEEMEHKSYHEIFVCTLLAQLITIFCREIDDRRMIPKVLAELGDQRALILRYIYMHLSDKMTLDRLSKQFYMSKSSISKYILEKTGLSFNELLNEMRVTKTVNYLLYTDFTLEELASIVGYVDAAHISKVFASRMDDKIGNYRRTYGNALHVGKIKETKQEYRIIEYLLRNFAEDLTAQSVADKFQISLIELNKVLLSQVQKNFYDFLNLVRINKACEFLIETDMDITDIAIGVGYNTVKAFRRNFVQLRHMNPSEFRNNVHIQE
ncbi:AraC family transcriptional regulator [Clostridium aminobutyricum]|uniref:Helix-turn-helix transcriptional regulator n=1 Tax=Clostridium aminobutyricum TaxID=33953 RepID=A0A939DA19_CLOAM|nr:AraC family transcriptional regulator [Clostridium aminobutyricum]MBN7773870.1 helix-turn-helix transcriptional regulator [Clostridium aminobutyricum]